MVKESIDVLGLLRKRGVEGDVDFLREAMAVLVQAIMEAEVTEQVGADYGERAPERLTQRNGYRPRPWDTRVGTLGLRIPKLREGSYFPSLLEPRRRSERALLSVIQQAYVEGVSTRRVDDLVKALGCDGISKSQVSRICQELDAVVEAFLGRPLDGGPYVYVWLDALTQKVREGGRIVNVCVVVATAVNREWRREVLGIDVGTSEDGAFWLAFLRSLVARAIAMDGHDIVTAEDGAEALEILNREHGAFDLLLTDIKMPVMDGIALALAAARDFPRLTILLMTGFADQRERASGLNAIVHDVVTKPFSVADIRTAVADALAARKAE